MPVLENPAVTIVEYSSGLTRFSQPVNVEASAQNTDTDVGLNDRLGLNVRCASIHLYTLPVAGTQVEMSIHLNEEWAEKTAMIASWQKEHDLSVRETASAYGGATSLSVRGAENIISFGNHLRSVFAESAHEGASIGRHIVHPALLGEVMDAVEGIIARSVEPKSCEWKEKFPGYGWKM